MSPWQPAAFFFLATNVIEHRHRIFKLFQHRVLDHLGIDHVLQLKLVEREYGHHLHETRRQNLPLRQLDVQFVLKKQRLSLKVFRSWCSVLSPSRTA
jgi:hypothetical protein